MSEEEIKIDEDPEVKFKELGNSMNESQKYLDHVSGLKDRVRKCYQKEKKRRDENKARLSKCVGDIKNLNTEMNRIDRKFKDTIKQYSTDESDLLKPKSLLLTIISYFFFIIFVVIIVKFMQSYGTYVANKRNYSPIKPPPV